MESTANMDDDIPPLMLGTRFKCYRDVNRAIEKYREENGLKLALRRAVKLENYCLTVEQMRYLNFRLKYGELDYSCCLHTGRLGRPGHGAKCPKMVRLKLSPDAQSLVVYDFHQHDAFRPADNPADQGQVVQNQSLVDLVPLPLCRPLGPSGDVTLTPIKNERVVKPSIVQNITLTAVPSNQYLNEISVLHSPSVSLSCLPIQAGLINEGSATTVKGQALLASRKTPVQLAPGGEPRPKPKKPQTVPVDKSVTAPVKDGPHQQVCSKGVSLTGEAEKKTGIGGPLSFPADGSVSITITSSPHVKDGTCNIPQKSPAADTPKTKLSLPQKMSIIPYLTNVSTTPSSVTKGDSQPKTNSVQTQQPKSRPPSVIKPQTASSPSPVSNGQVKDQNSSKQRASDKSLHISDSVTLSKSVAPTTVELLQVKTESTGGVGTILATYGKQQGRQLPTKLSDGQNVLASSSLQAPKQPPPKPSHSTSSQVKATGEPTKCPSSQKVPGSQQKRFHPKPEPTTRTVSGSKQKPVVSGAGAPLTTTKDGTKVPGERRTIEVVTGSSAAHGSVEDKRITSSEEGHEPGPPVKKLRKAKVLKADSSESDGVFFSNTELAFSEKQHLTNRVLFQLLRVTSQLPMVQFSHALDTLETLTDAFRLRQRVTLSISHDDQQDAFNYKHLGSPIYGDDTYTSGCGAVIKVEPSSSPSDYPFDVDIVCPPPLQEVLLAAPLLTTF